MEAFENQVSRPYGLSPGIISCVGVLISHNARSSAPHPVHFAAPYVVITPVIMHRLPFRSAISVMPIHMPVVSWTFYFCRIDGSGDNLEMICWICLHCYADRLLLCVT